MKSQSYKEPGIRNSNVNLNEVYFWTDTIKDWHSLLAEDQYKSLIISCWQELIQRDLINIYGFVIMPNHLHVIWEMKELNGKERPNASFNKYTSHMFLKDLRANRSPFLVEYKVDESERRHRFWQRDPLAIPIDSKKKLEQKLLYVHHNPLQERWSLVKRPEEYRWSSAGFYVNGIDEFGVLTHYADRF